jgi:two-component system response regulator RegA
VPESFVLLNAAVEAASDELRAFWNAFMTENGDVIFPPACGLAAATNPEQLGIADGTFGGRHPDRSLLIVDDDESFRQRLARGLVRHGFAVQIADTVADSLVHAERSPPAFAIVDLRLAGGNGLDVVSALAQSRRDARVIVVTGYGNIETAVSAVRRGAVDYLCKPVDADDVAAALLARDGQKAEPPQCPMSAMRVRWEHIQGIYEQRGRNLSSTARGLGMHRRTLQRLLARGAPK